ncbi:MAG: cupin domain-containing protein [Roseovarius sp.]
MHTTLLDIDATSGENRTPDPAIVLSGAPSSVLWNGVDLGAGQLLCGQWVGQPGEMTVKPRAHHEMFTVISGLIELVEPNGKIVQVGPGQAGFIPKGWTGVWRNVHETRKTYLMLKSVPGEAE